MADSDNSRTLPAVTREDFHSSYGMTFPTERVAKAPTFASSNNECRLIPMGFKQSIAVRQILRRAVHPTCQDLVAAG
jgi:hypothetical protein